MENVPAAEAALVSVADRPYLVPRRGRRLGQIAGSVASHTILLILVLFALAPLLEALSTSFKTKREINTGRTLIPQNPTTSQFEYVLGQTDFANWMRN